MMNTREEFEKLWHPICPEYDSITSSHVFDFYETCQALNDKRIAELEGILNEQRGFLSGLNMCISNQENATTDNLIKCSRYLDEKKCLFDVIAELEEKLRVAEQRQTYSSTGESNWD